MRTAMGAAVKISDPGLHQLAAILADLTRPRGSPSQYRICIHIAEQLQLGGSSNAEKSERGKSELRRIKLHERDADAAKAWAIFEALHLAGFTWCSGPLGLLARRCLADLIGIIWCMKSTGKYERHLGYRLEDLCRNAPLALGYRIARRPELDDLGYPPEKAASYARGMCVLKDSLHEAFRQAWRLWASMDHDVVSLCREREFPIHAYVEAQDEAHDVRERESQIFTHKFFLEWFIQAQGVGFGSTAG